jgi:hypothetical protein
VFRRPENIFSQLDMSIELVERRLFRPLSRRYPILVFYDTEAPLTSLEQQQLRVAANATAPATGDVATDAVSFLPVDFRALEREFVDERGRTMPLWLRCSYAVLPPRYTLMNFFRIVGLWRIEAVRSVAC